MVNRKRRCQGCGFEFWAEHDEEFCSAICAGTVSAATVLVAVQQLARLAARGQ